MLAVTLTIGTLVSVMFFFVGGMVGWLAKEHVYNTQPVYTHPEMFDAVSYTHLTLPTIYSV